jgi:hypothetical protein
LLILGEVLIGSGIPLGHCEFDNAHEDDNGEANKERHFLGVRAPIQVELSVCQNKRADPA